jgi:hypothetical protein
MPSAPEQGWIDLLNNNGLATVLVFCGLIAMSAFFSAVGAGLGMAWRFLRPRIERAFQKHDTLLDTLTDTIPTLAQASATMHGAVLETRDVVKGVDNKVDRLLEKKALSADT